MTEQTRPSTSLKAPALRDVRLLPGTPFYDRQQDMNTFLLAQDPDSMLYNFRAAAGLPTFGAKPMTGWDADECKLKGHTTGHYLSGLALAYAASGEERFRAKAEYITDALAECQHAFGESGKVHPGFLSAYDEEQFDLLEQYTKYPDIWAPYYTLDKIMSGLLDAYELAGIGRAADVLDPLGDWVYARLSRLDDETRSRMWSMYIAGEFGAMISTMVRLSRITGKATHLSAAKLFENDNLFGQMAEGRDGLDSMHANQHIPQISGALELYAETGCARYLDIAFNFERIVTGHHCYCIGGTGEEERFRAPDSETQYLTEKTAESCASYNMLRLSGRLFEFMPETWLMDYYERTLFNHILMSCSHTADGGTTYFLPLSPGSSKHYETEENSCCHGTGMENRYRYMTQIYSVSEDSLRINLPVSSRLAGDEDITLVFDECGVLTVTAGRDMDRELLIRIPEWAVQMRESSDNGWMHFGRLHKGDEIRLEFPMELREAYVSSDPAEVNLAWGPYLLAAVSDSAEMIKAPETGELRACGRPGDFEADGMLFRPLYRIDSEKYHVYFRK